MQRLNRVLAASTVACGIGMLGPGAVDAQAQAAQYQSVRVVRGTISGMDPTFMPRSATMEDLDDANSQIIKIQTKGLDRVIKQVGTFVQDEKRYQDINLTGVLATFNNSAVTMMSCDGSRLCVRTIPVTGDLPDSTLHGSANLLVMPNLEAANICYNLLKTAAGNNVAVGPILLGAAAPVHILTPSTTVRRIVNMTALTVTEANAERALL